MKRIALPGKIELNMTPMIDIVFMLLAFFIMTLKFVEPEGDFNIRMPLGAADTAQTTMDQSPEPFRVRLLADPAGRLTEIRLGERSLGTDFGKLRAAVFQLIGGDRAPGDTGYEVELDPDDHLHYEHTIAAITAVSGYIDGGRIHPLVERVTLYDR